MQADRTFIQIIFGENRDKTQRLQWEHALDVGDRLHSYLDLQPAVSPERKLLLWRAAIGHDILEDTAVTENELAQRWGEDCVFLIKALTNQKGDGDFSDYLELLRTADEEIQLIKLCDIESNVFNSLTTHQLAGKQWLNDFWLPLLRKYAELFSTVTFQKFPLAGQAVLTRVLVGIEVLENLKINVEQ